MRPVLVKDEDVRELIRSLCEGQKLPSGAAVRMALGTHFGSRGGVARVYRLLAEERERRNPPAPAGSLEALQREVQALRAQLQLAHEREDASQTYWAEQVDRLRQRIAELQPLARPLQRDADVLLRHRLLHAERRIAELEQQLQLRASDGE